MFCRGIQIVLLLLIIAIILVECGSQKERSKRKSLDTGTQTRNKKGNRGKRAKRLKKEQLQNSLYMVIDQEISLRRNVTTSLPGSPIQGWKSYHFKPSFIQGQIGDGVVTITKQGLYLIFAKITFSHSTKGMSQYSIYVNGVPHETCMSKVKEEDIGSERFKQCHTGSVTYIDKGANVFIAGVHQGWVVNPDKSHTYWGITRLTKKNLLKYNP